MEGKKKTKLKIQYTPTGVPFAIVPDTKNILCCTICGGPKTTMPFRAPVRIGDEASVRVNADGTRANLEQDIIPGTGQGCSLLYLVPLQTCNKRECMDAAYEIFKADCAAGPPKDLNGYRWKPSLYHCKSCLKFDEDLKKCAQCGSARYCSLECQHLDWNEHKQTCKK
jgi:hypothetical protein